MESEKKEKKTESNVIFYDFDILFLFFDFNFLFHKIGIENETNIVQ